AASPLRACSTARWTWDGRGQRNATSSPSDVHLHRLPSPLHRQCRAPKDQMRLPVPCSCLSPIVGCRGWAALPRRQSGPVARAKLLGADHVRGGAGLCRGAASPIGGGHHNTEGIAHHASTHCVCLVCRPGDIGPSAIVLLPLVGEGGRVV